MKKILCCLAALFLFVSAQAEGSLITGQIKEGALTDSPVYVLLNDTALAGSVGDITLTARLEQEILQIGTGDMALRLRLPKLGSLKDDILARLDQQPTYENAVYSSLFIQAQQIELTAAEVAALAREVLTALPLLDADGAMMSALKGINGSETWATVTRYVADERQYPNTWMLLVNVFSPVLPALHAEIRSDEYGANFTLAVSVEPVTDWDETIAAISDAVPGDMSRGRLIRGFTMVDDGAQKWIYVECACYGFALPLRLGVDIYIDAIDFRQWTADFDVINDDTQEHLFCGSLESTVTGQEPEPTESAAVIDLTDGMDDAERALLNW